MYPWLGKIHPLLFQTTAGALTRAKQSECTSNV